MALANFKPFHQPKAFLLMGGLVNSGTGLIDFLQTYFESYLLEVYTGKVEIPTSGREGKTTAICGVGALIWEGR